MKYVVSFLVVVNKMPTEKIRLVILLILALSLLIAVIKM
jgi:hypothetical protein